MSERKIEGRRYPACTSTLWVAFFAIVVACSPDAQPNVGERDKATVDVVAQAVTLPPLTTGGGYWHSGYATGCESTSFGATARCVTDKYCNAQGYPNFLIEYRLPVLWSTGCTQSNFAARPDTSDPYCTTCCTACFSASYEYSGYSGTPCSTGYLDGTGACTTNPVEDQQGATTPEDEQLRPDPSPNKPTDKLCYGMCAPNVHTMPVSLALNDTPVGYQPAKGPAAFVRLTYNHRGASLPSSPGFFNVGAHWTVNLLSYIEDDPGASGLLVKRYVAGGGVIDYSLATGSYDYGTETFGPEKKSGAVLRRVDTSGVISYQLTFPDGSQQIFEKLDGATTYPRRVFLTQLIDAQGLALTMTYDANLRLTKVTDATARETKLCYNSGVTDPANAACLSGTDRKVYRIFDPFKRYATLTYVSSGAAAGQLASITDAAGITSSFSYDTSGGGDPGFITQLTTPYGSTGFSQGTDSMTGARWLELTDPLGWTERIESRSNAPGIAAGGETVPSGMTVPNGALAINNTFHWDKYAYPSYGTGAGKDYSKATRTHWLLNTSGQTIGTPSARKKPLEDYQFYNYPDQPDEHTEGSINKPAKVGRILPGGASQVASYDYNAQGNIIKFVDPVGRETTFDYYSGGVDLQYVKQKNGASSTTTIASYGTYTAHRPDTYTDAAGNLVDYTWNGAGQLTQVTDQGGRVTKYAYDGTGRATTTKRTISGSDVTLQTLAYTANCGLPTYTTHPNCDLPSTITDSEGLVRTFQYDSLDRTKRVTYADATYQEFTYTNLDLTTARDRLGRNTTYSYNANRWLSSVTQPVNIGSSITRATTFNYYRNGVLAWMTDANSKVTSWSTDLEGHTTGKTYNNGASGGWGQTFDSAGRPSVRTDALSQTRTFAYNADDTISGVTYGSPYYAGVTTSNVSFTYDTYYPRITSMTDGNGTTDYGYIDPNTSTSGAGHVLWEDGPTSGDGLVYGYDALNRLLSRTVEEAGGGGDKTESWSYDVLDRATSHVTELGTFTYAFNGRTPYPTSRSLNSTSISTAWAYDTNTNDRRLTTITNTPGRDYTTYVIDDAERITSHREVPGTSSASYNLVTPTHDDADRLTNYVQQPKTAANANTGTTVTWSYAYDKLDSFTSFSNTAASSTLSPSTNALNQQSGFGGTFTYDANGNLASEPSRSYKWDIENRLALITQGTTTVAFKYDGLGRRTHMITTVSGTPTEIRYLWSGDTLVHARNTSNVVTRRYYAEGEHRPGSSEKLIYMTDHLGSVRDVVSAATSSGSIVGTRDYSPYGGPKTVSGTVPDFTYAGLFNEPTSSNLLSKTRAYNPYIGHWLSRDSIGERGGFNLYGYAAASPAGMVDSDGREAITMTTVAIIVIATTPPIIAFNYWWQETGLPQLKTWWQNSFTPGVLANQAAEEASLPEAAGDCPTPEELEGKTPEQIDEIMREKGWKGEPSRDGETRYPHPSDRGTQVRITKGLPGSKDPVKDGGPSVVISRPGKGGGEKVRVPIAGNKLLD